MSRWSSEVSVREEVEVRTGVCLRWSGIDPQVCMRYQTITETRNVSYSVSAEVELERVLSTPPQIIYREIGGGR